MNQIQIFDISWLRVCNAHDKILCGKRENALKMWCSSKIDLIDLLSDLPLINLHQMSRIAVLASVLNWGEMKNNRHS